MFDFFCYFVINKKMSDYLSKEPEKKRTKPLFEITKNRKPSLEKLTPENKLKLLLWLAEIQNWQEIDNKDEITIFEVKKNYKKIRENKETSNEELERLRAGITKFKGSPEFWKHDYKNPETYQNDELVLLKLLYRIGFKNEVENIVDKVIQEGIKPIIIKTLRENKKIDNRASSALYESIWYMEQMNFSAENQNVIFETIQEIELLYRNKERKSEKNPHQQDLKELSFNHLVRVQRITWALLESSQFNNFAEFPEKDRREAEKILNNPEEILKLSLIALGHDLLEDGKFENPAKLTEFLKKIVKKHLPEERVDTLIDEVVDSINRLNTHNFINQDGTRNYDVYINGGSFINQNGEEQTVRPLTFMERLVKFSDISHNYQTKIKTTSENEFKNKELQNKIPTYMKFIGKHLYLAKNLPWRITNNMMKFNLSTLIQYEEWQKLLKIHQQKNIPENLDNWNLK